MDSELLVLIAEDNEDDAFIMRHVLAKAGLPNPTHVCRDGTEVISYLTGEGVYKDRVRYPFPRLLLLDLKMPKVGGLDLLRWIKKHPDCAVIPTIVFSSSNQPQDVEEAYRLGVNAYLMKPATAQGMEALLRSIYEFWRSCEMPAIRGQCAENPSAGG